MTDTDATNFLPSIDAVDRIRERLRARRMPMGSQHPDALCLLADEILEAQSTELASLRARLAQAEGRLPDVIEACAKLADAESASAYKAAEEFLNRPVRDRRDEEAHRRMAAGLRVQGAAFIRLAEHIRARSPQKG